MHLNGFDIIIISLITLSTLLGLARGFIMEVVCLIPWVVAITLAMMYSPVFDQKYLEGGREHHHNLLAFFIVFVPAFLLGILGAHYVKEPVKESELSRSGTNKALGMIYGFLRGLLFLLIVFVSIDKLGMTGSGFYDNSALAKPLGGFFVAPPFINNEVNNVFNNPTTTNVTKIAQCIIVN